MRLVPILRGSLAAAGVALLVTACSGGDDEPAAQASPPAAAGSSAAGGASGSTGPTPTAPPPGQATGTGTRTPGPPARATSGAPVAVTPLPPAPVGKPATVKSGVDISLAKVDDVTRVDASGPGETAGPGVAVTIVVKNTGTDAFDLDGLAVNAYFAPRNTPANPGGSAKATPLQGQLAGGKTATGTYYFTMTAAQAKTLRVEVSSSSSPNIAVFQR
jgi:hypothetical protein